MAHRRLRSLSFPLVFTLGGVLVALRALARRPASAPRVAALEDELAESESSWLEWRGAAGPVLVERRPAL